MELDTTQKQVLFTKRETSSKYWLPVPVRAVAYVTGECNYGCNHCYASDFSGKELTAGEYGDVFRKLSQWGVFEIVFLGGEPFSRTDF